MPQDPNSVASLFTQVDISPSANSQQHASGRETEAYSLLRQILAAQDRQNELLEELIGQLGSSQRQRASELSAWRDAHPELAHACRQATEALSRAQVEFLRTLTEEVQMHSDSLLDGEFMLNEFVDRFGPRLAHLNGVLQVMSQLGSTAGDSHAH